MVSNKNRHLNKDLYYTIDNVKPFGSGLKGKIYNITIYNRKDTTSLFKSKSLAAKNIQELEKMIRKEFRYLETQIKSVSKKVKTMKKFSETQNEMDQLYDDLLEELGLNDIDEQTDKEEQAYKQWQYDNNLPNEDPRLFGDE